MKSSEAELREIAVYAPIGLAALCAEKVLPLLKEESANLRQQVPAARFIGQMATQQAKIQLQNRRDLGHKQLSALLEMGNSVMTQFAGWSQCGAKGSGSAEQSAPSSTAGASVASEASAMVPPASIIDEADLSTSTTPPVELRAIEGYDNLSAPQIISLLEDLNVLEREEVESYERANRQRRTILNRIVQLRSV